MPVTVIDKECIGCHVAFKTHISSKVYCSPRCVNNYYKKRSREANNFINLSRGTIGALAELMACVDLMRNGYEVFRAMSPSSDCDVIAIKDGITHKIEVRSANYFISKTGDKKMHYPKKRTAGKVVIAVTHSDNKVHYINWG